MAESQVPLKLRKQMLVMRAAVERVELAQHVLNVRQAATISAIVRNALPGQSSRGVASRAVDAAKRYPFVLKVATTVASRFKLPILKFASKWGGAATVAYKLWQSWQKSHPSTPRSARRPR